MKNAIQGLNRLRQPNVLSFSASWGCYPGCLGFNTSRPVMSSTECNYESKLTIFINNLNHIPRHKIETARALEIRRMLRHFWGREL